MANEHHIGTAGLHGYLPNYCGSYESYEDAVGGLADIHELGRDRTRSLRRDAYLELNLQRDGNEYCEIVSCDCDDADVHNDA